jgi:hypothetical protein
MSQEKIKSAKELKQILKDIADDQKRMSDAELNAIKIAGDARRAMLEETQRAGDALIELSKTEAAALSEQGELQESLIQQLREQAGLTEEQIQRIQNSNDRAAEMVVIAKERNKLQQEHNDLANEYDSMLGGIAAKIGIGNSALNKSVNKFKEQAVLLKTSEKHQNAFRDSLIKTFSPGNLLGSVLEGIVASTALAVIQIDKMQSAFSSLAGTGEKFDAQMASVARNSLDFGINGEIASEAFTALQQNLIGFNKESDTSIENLTMQVGQLKRFGIEGELAVGIINDLNAVLGVNATEAAEMTKQIALSAVELGIGPKMMADNFRKASAVLAVHGKKSVDVFKGLAVAARNAGTSVDTLLSIAGKFDTFSDAADAAGRLNSILGSTMSATEMLMMTEDERIETLIKTVNGQGTAFREMDRFTQKAIAQAAGINDMAEANRIFGMSLGAYRQQAADAKAAEIRQNKYNDAIKATVPIQEKLTEALAKIAANSETVNGAIDALVGLIDIFSAGLSMLGPNGVTVIGVLTLIGFVGTKLVTIFSGLSTIFTALSGTSKMAGKSVQMSGKQMNQGLQQTGQGAGAAAGGLIKLGVAALLIGGGIAIAALGLAELARSFQGLGDAAPYAMGAIIGFTLSFAILMGVMMAMGAGPQAAAIGIAVGLLLGIGVAALMIGVAVEKASGGIEKMASSLGTMFEAMTGAGDVLGEVKKGVVELAEAITGLPDNKKVALQATLQNLALISSGQAASLEGVAGFSNIVNVGGTNVDNNVSVIVEIDGEQFDGRIRRVRDEDQ